MAQELPDVYTNSEIDNYPGARERSRPGQGDREETYGKTYDAKGNPVSAKPANGGVLASQRRRLEHERALADRAARAASSSSSSSTSPSPTRSKNTWTTLLLIALFLPLLSSFLTGSTSYSFNLAPHVLPPLSKWWRLTPLNPYKAKLKTFTPHTLSRYDGRREDRPLYIAVGGEVYDVSSNRRIYGPGGSYHVMAGKDVSRAYITGCFQTDLTHDLRGLSKNDLKALENWKTFFANHDTYRLVGHVTLPPIDPNSPIPPDCRKGEAGGEEEQTHAGKHAGHAKPGPVKATKPATAGQTDQTIAALVGAGVI